MKERANEEADRINLSKQRLKKFNLHLPRKGYQHNRSLADTHEDLLARLDERDLKNETSAFAIPDVDYSQPDPFFRDFRPRKHSLPVDGMMLLNQNSSNALSLLERQNRFKSRHMSLYQTDSGLPHQIQTFLNRKPPKEEERERFDTSVQMITSTANFKSVSSMHLEQMQSVGYLRQHQEMTERFGSSRLLPCEDKRAPAVSLAMQKISKILVEARKQEFQSLGLRGLTSQLRSKIK